jgi:3-dehydroquinate dehydratase-1
MPPGGILHLGALPLGRRPLVVAAGGEEAIDALAGVRGADAIELRADLFADPDPAAVAAILVRLRAAGRPVILTVRAATEGGKPLVDARRQALYDAGLAHVDAVDIEIASTALLGELVPRARAAGRLVILSAHMLDRTPPADTLLPLVERARTLGAHLTKLATHARDLDDLRTLLEVTLAARTRDVVTLAMGTAAGPLSRLVLPAAGSLLTYGHVGRETAPGQLGVEELAALVHRFF